MFGTSDSPATVLLGHDTLIFKFSMSEIGGDQLLGKVHTDLGPEIRKRKKTSHFASKPQKCPPPPRENAHMQYMKYEPMEGGGV